MTKSLNLMLAYWFERSGFVTRRISTGSNLAGGSLLHIGTVSKPFTTAERFRYSVAWSCIFWDPIEEGLSIKYSCIAIAFNGTCEANLFAPAFASNASLYVIFFTFSDARMLHWSAVDTEIPAHPKP